MRHARDQIRALTVRSRLLLPPEAVVQDINVFLRGWMAYFRYGHSAARFAKIRDYATLRLAIFIGKRHKRGRRFGLNPVAYLSPDRYGLISMSGVVARPGRTSPGGRNRMPPVNGVGEPGAGEPHARFEVAGAGKGMTWPRSPGVAQPTGKPAEERPWAYRQTIITSPVRPDQHISAVPIVQHHAAPYFSPSRESGKLPGNRPPHPLTAGNPSFRRLLTLGSKPTGTKTARSVVR